MASDCARFRYGFRAVCRPSAAGPTRRLATRVIARITRLFEFRVVRRCSHHGGLVPKSSTPPSLRFKSRVTADHSIYVYEPKRRTGARASRIFSKPLDCTTRMARGRIFRFSRHITLCRSTSVTM